MLKVYTGYNLSNIRGAVHFDFTDLTPPKEIIEKFSQHSSKCTPHFSRFGGWQQSLFL